MLPLHINVRNKKVLVVGGGKIAYRRLQLFLQEEASITVVSPEVVPEIMALHNQQQLIWYQKEVQYADLTDYFIIIAATNNHSVNEWIAQNVSNNQLVNIASSADLGNVIVPKSVKKGRLTLSVSTNGASPKLAKQICEQLSLQFDEQFIEELDRMYEKRLENKKNNIN